MNKAMTFKKSRIAIYFIICCFILPLSVSAATYYVAANGNDSGSGSQSSPWRTLSRACSTAGSFGDRIIVNAGNYTDNGQCVLARGVSIQGAGASQVTINTSASPYIIAANNVPVVDGSNEISGIKFEGGDRTGMAILSRGRSNQKFHDCVFANFTGNGVAIYGKYGWTDNNGGFWRDDCTSGTRETCSWAYNNPLYSVDPASTDWATGVLVYNNLFNDCKLFPNVLSGAKIYGNTFNNDGTYGGKRSAIGHTAFWYKSVEIHDNIIRVGNQGWSVIGIEMWEIKDSSKFYNNTTDSWFSLRGSTHGLSSGHSLNYEIYNNRFIAAYGPTTPCPAIEIMSDIQGAQVYGNYFSGSAWESGIAIWGATSGANKSTSDILENIVVRNNVFDRLTGSGSLGGVHLDANFSVTVVRNIDIYNNVFDGNKQGVNMGKESGRLETVNIKNNIFMNQTDKAIVTNGSGMGPINVSYNFNSGNNLWLGDWAGAISQSNTINASPNLQKSGSRPDPYYLASGASANVVDAGTSVGLSYAGARPDIGAYEYGQAPPVPNPDPTPDPTPQPIPDLAVYYVDIKGSDSTGNGASATPFATLSRACSLVKKSGVKIHVNAGTYTDNTPCVLARGVSIEGAGAGQVTINTSASPYILAASNVPAVNGGNEISGITLNGQDRSGMAILSRGRSNQKIHNCTFANFTGNGVAVYGKYGYDDSNGGFWRDDCTASTTATCSWAYNNPVYSVDPASTDWATGVDIYSNTFNDCKLYPGVLSGAKIHGNTFNNNGTYGAKRSAIGHTAFWFKSCEVYDNVIRVGDQGWSVIGIEMWENRDGCKFYSNTTDSWFSLRGSSHGLSTGQTVNYEIYNNRFEASYTPTAPAPALEIMSDVQGAQVYGNYFSGSAWEYGIAIWGATSGANRSGDDGVKNIMVRNNIFDRITNAGSYGGVHVSANNINTAVDNVSIYNNVFDGNKQGINLGKNGGRLGSVRIMNNVFVNHTDKAVVTNGSGMGPVTLSYNINFNNGTWVMDWAGAITQSNIISLNPDLMKSGVRPDPYYQPTGGSANLVDAGINVGLPFNGSSPDIGAYECNEPPLPPPTGLRIVQ